MKKKVILFPLFVIIGFSLIIAIPIGVLSDNLSTYDIYDNSYSYEYNPDVPSAIESLNLNIELGNVEIKYVDPPVDYYAKIDVYIKMLGPGLAGKDCFDFFVINEGNLTYSPFDFSLELQPGLTSYEINSLIKNVSIIVSLSKTIIFNISAIGINGNIELTVPYNVQVNNINTQITSGDILFDLRNCILEGNIIGMGLLQSNIEIRSYNVKCTRDNIWYLYTNNGDLIFNISQSDEMGANITAIGELNEFEAEAIINYNDFSPNVGLNVTLNQWDDFYPQGVYAIGFPDATVLNTIPNRTTVFTSFDYPAQNNFNISLYRNELDHIWPYFWYLYSEPVTN
jgi:hypothetical protein